MKKVQFLVLHLGFGGAEQAVISDANLLSEFCEVEIVAFYKLYDEPAFPVKPSVKISYLTENIKPNKNELKAAIKSKNILTFIKEALKSVKILHLRRSLMIKAIKNSDADIIISSRYIYHKLLTDNAKASVICIAQEHNHHNFDNKYINRQLKAVKKMDYFMPVSNELTLFYKDRVNDGVVCKYIPHHLEAMPQSLSPLKGKNIISVGRLSPEKGMDELIYVFAEVVKTHSEWKLNIVGDGDERQHLQELIVSLGLESSVILHGFKSKEDISALMLDSSIYVMASHTESFGLVLIEAQSFGIPCVAYDSAQGAKEIITSEKNGVLIKNRNRSEMVAAVNRLIANFEYRKQIGLKGRENAQSFSYDSVKQKWIEFIDSM